MGKMERGQKREGDRERDTQMGRWGNGEREGQRETQNKNNKTNGTPAEPTEQVSPASLFVMAAHETTSMRSVFVRLSEGTCCDLFLGKCAE